MQSELKTLTFSVTDQVGWIRLTRPEKHNPLDMDLRKDLMQVLDRLREDHEIRVVVLAGSDGAFCAGGNLKLLRENAEAGTAYWHQRIKTGLRMIEDLLNLGKPLIAVVDGPAFGAGFSLALAADLVLATPRARFAMSYLKLGLIPDLGPLYLLPRIVGLQRAKELILSARVIDAAEAQALGIVMELQGSGTIEARAQELALSMAKISPTALSMTKAILNLSMDTDRASLFAMEALGQAAAFASPEPIEAIDMMLNKQMPPFKGFPKLGD